jgi:hypothetical protein
LVTALLPLAIAFHLLSVVLAILLPVARMCRAPLPRTLHGNLPVNRIGSDLPPVIIAAALPLAWKLGANELLRMIGDRLKDLLAIAATAITHQTAPDQNVSRSFCPQPPKLIRANEKFTAYRNFYRVFYRISAQGLVLINPAELMLFYTGTDTLHDLRPIASLVSRPQRQGSAMSGPTKTVGPPLTLLPARKARSVS